MDALTLGMDDEAEAGCRAVVLTVAGHPRPQPRARVMGAGRGVAATAGKQAKLWRTRVTEAARELVDRAGGAWAVQQRLGAGQAPLELALEVRLPTADAERWGRWHTLRPDGDNLCKLVLDAFADAGLLPGDDCAVAVTRVEKRWARPEQAGITARVAVLGDTHEAAWQAPAVGAVPGWLAG